MGKLLTIIPKNLNPSIKKSPKDFTRKRKLPLPKLIVFILSVVAAGQNQGVDNKSGIFFRDARRSGLWPNAEAVHRSSLSKARKKVSWKIFRELLQKAVALAYEVWPEKEEFLWHGMSAVATDGSKFNLPATKKIRNKFDSKSGLEYSGRGHYPQCLVSTVYDVFRRLPIARTVVGINESSERNEVKKLLPFVPQNSLWMFDRGYPSFDLIAFLIAEFSGKFLFRCPAFSTFPAVEAFIKSKKKEAVIWLTPSHMYLSKIPLKDRKNCKSIKLRVVRLISPDGVLSVLLTNLYEKKKFQRKEIIDLYFRRWEIESYYRDEKIIMEVERFHSKTVNGILQELYASMIMSTISRTIMVLSAEMIYSGEHEFQFKNAIVTLASEAAILAPDDPEKAVLIFDEIITEISRVKYYRPKTPRVTNPRVCKRPLNKWCNGKIKTIKEKK